MSTLGRVHLYMDGGNFHHLVLKRLRARELDFSFDDLVAKVQEE
mgnify:CR=1 FL=1